MRRRFGGEGQGAGGHEGRGARRGPERQPGPGQGPLTQDATRSRVWGRRAKLTGSRAAPARPAPNEAPSMAGPGGTRAPAPCVRLSVRPAPPEAARVRCCCCVIRSETTLPTCRRASRVKRAGTGLKLRCSLEDGQDVTALL